MVKCTIEKNSQQKRRKVRHIKGCTGLLILFRASFRRFFRAFSECFLPHCFRRRTQDKETRCRNDRAGQDVIPDDRCHQSAKEQGRKHTFCVQEPAEQLFQQKDPERQQKTVEDPLMRSQKGGSFALLRDQQDNEESGQKQHQDLDRSPPFSES